jgi:hypothetical protein
MGWTIRRSNPGGGEIFRTREDRPRGPPILLYKGYPESFPVVKRPERGVNHPHPSSAEVKERVELYLYSLSGPSWPVLGRTLPYQIFRAGVRGNAKALRYKREGSGFDSRRGIEIFY